jgi:hypothetical protein
MRPSTGGAGNRRLARSGARGPGKKTLVIRSGGSINGRPAKEHTPMPRIRDEHDQRGGKGLPVPSHNGSGPAKNIPHDALPAPRVKQSVGIRLVRYGLPAGILLGGIVVAIVVPGSAGEEGVVTMFGICLCVALFNSLVRLGVSSDRDRDKEQAAREEYGRTGVWPDEPGRRR